jgi:cytochrome c biogenesis factor
MLIYNLKPSLFITLPFLYFLPLFLELKYNFNLTSFTHLSWIDMHLYNLLLNNSINKVHPALIYFSWIMLCIYSCYYVSAHLSYRLLNVALILVTSISFSLMLGSWWAYQEGSWGGWWNWDPSEMFGLLIFFSITLTLHITTNYNKTYLLLTRPILYILILYYAFLQLNFSLISHNFGIRQGDLVDFRIFYFFTFTLICYLYKTQAYKVYLSKAILNLLIIPMPVKFTFLSLAIFFVLYLSTLELWSTLIWNIFSIDIQNLSSALSFFNLLTIVFVSILYLSLNFLKVSPVLLLYLNSTLLTASILPIFMLLTSSFLSYHVIVISLLIVLFSYSTFTLTQSTYYSQYLFNDTVNLSIPLTIYSSNVFSFLYNSFTTLSASLLSNSPETKPFLLTNFNYNTLQGYYVNTVDIPVLSTSIDTFNIIPLLAYFILKFLIFLFSKYFLIIRI